MLSTIIEIIFSYEPAFIRGLLVTLELAGISWATGLVGGTLLGALSVRHPLVVGTFLRLTAFLLSGVPVIVLLFWLHYPAQSVFDVAVNPFYTAAFTFSLINLFSVASIIRTALIEFPDAYLVAAKVSGLGFGRTFFKIQLPLVIRQVLPSLLLLQVAILHMTLFASLISAQELFRVAQQINSNIYKPVEIYSALALFFLALSLPLNGLALYLKRRFSQTLMEF